MAVEDRQERKGMSQRFPDWADAELTTLRELASDMTGRLPGEWRVSVRAMSVPADAGNSVVAEVITDGVRFDCHAVRYARAQYDRAARVEGFVEWLQQEWPHVLGREGVVFWLHAIEAELKLRREFDARVEKLGKEITSPLYAITNAKVREARSIVPPVMHR